MAEETKISYVDHTMSPWIGCAHAKYVTLQGRGSATDHPGCENCYAERDWDIRRHRAKWGERGTRSVTSPASWRNPLRWNQVAELNQQRRRVLVSLCDVFEAFAGCMSDHKGERLTKVLATEEVAKQMDDVRREFFEQVVWPSPWLDWLIWTKRPENVGYMLPGPRCASWPDCDHPECVGDHIQHNVWLGVSVSDQASASALIPQLIGYRELFPVLAVSAEPLLGPINMNEWLPGIDWLIVGGESGPGSRPCESRWIEGLAGQALDSETPLFVKQMGSSFHALARRIRLNDPKGADPSEWAGYLRIQEFPQPRFYGTDEL